MWLSYRLVFSSPKLPNAYFQILKIFVNFFFLLVFYWYKSFVFVIEFFTLRFTLTTLPKLLYHKLEVFHVYSYRYTTPRSILRFKRFTCHCKNSSLIFCLNHPDLVINNSFFNLSSSISRSFSSPVPNVTGICKFLSLLVIIY